MATQLKLTWMDDLKAEHDLRELSVSFEVCVTPFSKIDLKESQYNGARIGDPIIRHLVEDYMTGMRNGDTFPRLVVYEGKSGFVILSGNQRAAAIKELIDSGELPKTLKIELYIVGTSDELLLEIIARSGNVGHGGRSGYDERLSHAIYSVRALGMRVKDAGKIFMISDGTIRNNISGEKTRDELAGAGVDLKNAPNSAVEPLAKISDDGIKVKLGHLIAQHNPTGQRVKQTVSAVRKARSHSAKLQHIKDLEKELAEETHRKVTKQANGAPRKVPRRPRRDRIIRDLNNLANYLDKGMDGDGFTKLADFQVSGVADEKAIRDLWSRVQFRMKMIVGRK